MPRKTLMVEREIAFVGPASMRPRPDAAENIDAEVMVENARPLQ